MLSLVLALLVTPVTYSLFDGLSRRFGRFWKWVLPAPGSSTNQTNRDE
jgi:hypothetical protein